MSQFSESEIELMQMERLKQDHPDNRLKLEAIILFAKTANKTLTAQELNISEASLSRWVHCYLEEGLRELLQRQEEDMDQGELLYFEQEANYQLLFEQLNRLKSSLPPHSSNSDLGVWLEGVQAQVKKMNDTFIQIKENKT